MFAIFVTGGFLPRVVLRDVENLFIVNRPVFLVKYAVNAFTEKTCYRDTWRRIEWLVPRMRRFTYLCRRRPLLFLLPSATFAPRASLARKEGREGGYQIPVPSLNLAQIPVPMLIFAKIPVTKSKIPLLMIICKIMHQKKFVFKSEIDWIYFWGFLLP